MNPGDQVEISTRYDPGPGHFALEVAIGLRGGGRPRLPASRVVIANPQLDTSRAWGPYISKGMLRPYVAWEAWDAPADSAEAGPKIRP